MVCVLYELKMMWFPKLSSLSTVSTSKFVSGDFHNIMSYVSPLDGVKTGMYGMF